MTSTKIEAATPVAASSLGPARPPVAAIAGVAAVLAALVWVVWDFTIDDAYISFRYSANVAAGRGFVWNPGEPVEGYTNWLWVVIAVLPAALGVSIATFMKVVGTAALAACAWQVYDAARRFAGSALAGWAALALFATFLPTYLHAVSGLETMLAALLFLRMTVVAVDIGAARREERLWELPALTLAAGLTRPEGLLVGVVCLGYVVLRSRPAVRRTMLASTLAVLVVPGLVYFVWRYRHFGHIFPNTFYVKAGDIAGGRDWVVRTLKAFALPLATTAVWLLRRRRPEAWLLLAVAIAAQAIYAVSAPMMNYAHRFAYHVFPLACVATAWAVYELVTRRWLASGLLAVLLGFTAFSGVRAAPPDVLLYGPYLDAAHAELGRALRDSRVPATYRSVAIGDAGAVPFFSDWETTDFVGLNDEPIAHGRNPTRRILERRPTIVVMYAADGTGKASSAFRADPARIMQEYSFVGGVQFRYRYWLNVYSRNALPRDVQAAVAEAIARVATPADGGRTRPPSYGEWFAHVRQRLPG